MTKKEGHSSRFAHWSIGSLFGLVLAAKAGWILYSKRYIDHHAKLKMVIDADQNVFESPNAGKLNYLARKTASGRPLLILHGLHMCAGMHDITPIFEAYSIARPTYALDLPGFGGSEKTDRPYRPSLYQAAIVDFVREVIGEVCDVIVFGASSEFVSLAALQEPDLFHSIIMVNPSGFQMNQSESNTEGKIWDNAQDLFYALLKIPLWSLPIYDLLASRPAILKRYRKYFSFAIPEELIDLAYTSAHQPGAHFAPMVFLSGKLGNPNIRDQVYKRINLPVLVFYDHQPGNTLDMLPFFVRENVNWNTDRARLSRGMPHFDQPGETYRAFDLFWKKLDKA